MSEWRELHRDLLLAQYLEALEAEDWETLAAVWQRAETDRELERALIEFSRGFLEEQGDQRDWDHDAERVRELVAEHFAERPAGEEPDRPLTAGDVAGRLRADLAAGSVRLSEADRTVNDRLQGNETPLPDRLGQTVLEGWCRNLNVEASRPYWRLFRQTAIRMSMARSQQQTRQAAREQTPKRRE